MKNRVLKAALLVIVLFIIINNLIYFPNNILCWDVFGYYLYLPFKFIYHDLGLKDLSVVQSIIDKYHSTGTFYQALYMPDGGHVMKYTMGLSILYAPFFLIGHLIATVTNYAPDGFSLPYQYSVFFGGIAYTILGIIVLAKVLMNFFNEKITSLVLIIIVFSTNFIVHMTMHGQNANSHNHLFLAYALILWLTILWHRSHKMKYMVFLGITCGIAILIRPSEVVCLFIPVFWGVKNRVTAIEKFHLLLRQWRQVVIFSLILLGTGSCQFIYWKIHTGHFLFNSYGGNAGEGFEFLHPYILNVLFSFRKGWLVYTPVMIFAIIGFIWVFKWNRPVFAALLLYFVFNLYIVSSWSCWWYSQCFSQRSLIQSYPVMAIPLGYFLLWMFQKKKWLKISMGIILSWLLLLNLFQTRQYILQVIDGDRMTKEYYFAVFGKLKATGEERKLLLVDRFSDGIEHFDSDSKYTSRLFKKYDFEEYEDSENHVAHSGDRSCRIDSVSVYSPAIVAPYSELTRENHAWIRVTAYVFPTGDTNSEPFSLIVQFTHKGYPYKRKGLDSQNLNLDLNQWNNIEFDYLTPEVRTRQDSLSVYFWNRGNSTIFIDDFQVEVFEKK